MRNRGLRTGVTLLICSAVLLAGINPPVVYHAHAAGDRPHRHDDAAQGHAAHDHGAQAHRAAHDRAAVGGGRCDHEHAHASPHKPHPHGRVPRPVQVLEPQPVGHLHVTLLGFTVYIPSDQGSRPEDRPGSADDRSVPADRPAPAESSLAMVRLAGTDAVGGANADHPLGIASIHPPVPLSTPVLRPREQGERATLRSLPLCDAARLERSGVRLI